jgi:hypothetical protein
MKIDPDLVAILDRHPEWGPFEHTTAWRPRPDDGDHDHCKCCGRMIVQGDECLIQYSKYTSLVFCLACYAENIEVISRWVN